MRPIKSKTFILPQIIKLTAITIVITLGLLYTTWQARFLIVGPEISIDNAPAVVQNERVVFIQGQADNTTRLYLNGRPIVTDPSGAFAEGVVLENGHTTVGIEAYDRYGRLTRWEQSLVYVETSNVVQR